MIRFCDKHPFSKYMDITVAPVHILAGENLWSAGKEQFKQYVSGDAADIRLIPVVNERQEVICHAYQDSEANRELRMLKELEENRQALQFRDVFSEIQEVIVCGCNELAFRFVRYLEKQQISVKVVGKYWDYFGYENRIDIDVNGPNKLVIFAEDIIPKTGDFYQTVIRSGSSEFECIDRIYEANVLGGRIKDTEGDLEEFLKKLKEKEVIILGTDISAQDTYDFLYGHGIDICCFAEWRDAEKRDIHRNLLGKNVAGIEEIINRKIDGIFIDSRDKNSALGTENVEFFDYYGYERNKQFFLIQDYTEVPCNNLLHVLKGKRVFLAGDEGFCAIVQKYLDEREQGDIDIVYVELAQNAMLKKTDILCVVSPCFELLNLTMNENPKVWCFWETLSKEGITSYTDYFSQVRTLVYIDLYRNWGKDKYSRKELCPKGILLGRIPYMNGNIFFRGILDGHPDILKWRFTTLGNTLFLYCIRLAGEKSENVLRIFKEMFNEEFAFRLEGEFTCWDKFAKSAEALLALKESFTSQELFVIFHISFAEMLCGYKIIDLNQKIIYWEPHMIAREDFPFLAQWLEDKQVHGQTIFMHRDMLVRAGSLYNFYQSRRDKYGKLSARIYQPGVYAEEITVDDVNYQQWEEFHVRFEDIKLHPHKELKKICGRLGIPWSDTMLRVTEDGEIWNYRGIFDFDIKPVFNKYEEWLSEFDRFRIALTNSLYQKKYGYTYENCMKFSRKELQEMFLKKFRFQEKLRFGDEKESTAYFLRTYRILMNQLWKVRKHMLLDDIVPMFGEVEIGEAIAKKQSRAEIIDQKELDKLLEFVREQKQLVLYGMGRDCEGLLKHLEEAEQSKLIFSDLKAEYTEMIFHGRKVIAPRELSERFKEYKILITSSQFYESMWQWLVDRGIEKDRITCNMFQLWE